MILSMSSSVKSLVPKTMASLLKKQKDKKHVSLPVTLKKTSQCIAREKVERRSLELEGLSQFSGVARVDFEDAAERVRMAPVRKLCVNKEAKDKGAHTSNNELQLHGRMGINHGRTVLKSLDNYTSPASVFTAA